jgi:hypothetical protein
VIRRLNLKAGATLTVVTDEGGKKVKEKKVDAADGMRRAPRRFGLRRSA